MFRITLKGLLAHMPRFVATLLAVVLGIAFLVGTMVLGDTVKKSFTDLFASVNRGTDAYVRSAANVKGEGPGDTLRRRVDESLVTDVRRVSGVAAAEPEIIANFTQIVGRDGKALGNPHMGAPTFGGNWVGTAELNPFKIAEGRPPVGVDDVVVDRASAKKGHLQVGGQVTVIVPNGDPRSFRVSGIARFGTADSPLGATFALFTLPTAEQELSQPGRIDAVRVRAVNGVSQDDLVARIRHTVPGDVEVLTGREITRENQTQIQKASSRFTIVFSSFAAVAVIVGGFVIFNTFSIIIAQRSREMALLRAIGAARAQVLRSVVVEALLVGVAASALGVIGGVAVGAGLKALFASFGLGIPAVGLVLRPAAVIIGMVVGVVVTLVSALAPAVKASRVLPIAAMRDVAVEQTRASRGRIITGLALTGAGAVLLLVSALRTGQTVLLAPGALGVLVGTVVLGPVVAGPTSRVVGSPVPALRGVTGAIARENAMRNPRRTAAAASALLVGVGVVSLLTVLYGSFRQSIDNQISHSFTGDLTVTPGGFGRGGFSPALASGIGRLPEVRTVASLRLGQIEYNGSSTTVTGIDPVTFTRVVDLDVRRGSMEGLRPDEIAVYDQKARDAHLGMGDRVTLRFAETGVRTFTVAALFHRHDIVTSFVLGTAAYDANVPNPLDAFIFVKFRGGVPFAQGRAAVERVSHPFANAKVQDQQELKHTFESQIAQIFAIMLVLLFLAILIALLGIANTLRLSVHERTRELGLLRAVGMTRAQVRSSVRWESAIISVFGTVGGIGLGLFFGWAVVRNIGRGQDTVFAVPAGLLAVILVVGALAGVVAAIRPASRAARLDLLQAIATE